VAVAAYPATHTLVGGQGEAAACQHLQLQEGAPGVAATLLRCCCCLLLLLLLLLLLEGAPVGVAAPATQLLLLLRLLAQALLVGVVAWGVGVALAWALLGVGVAWAGVHWTGPHVAVPCPLPLLPAHAAPPPAGFALQYLGWEGSDA
jgi:hypothetical protein